MRTKNLLQEYKPVINMYEIVKGRYLIGTFQKTDFSESVRISNPPLSLKNSINNSKSTFEQPVILNISS
ncbi:MULTISPECIES: hypothetical protein [unclassified Prochlorococcus]|uniref:hypothetical protein n=1 Tax=unclassified Prochlorococcus TaxID=2627481 RepID=UPI0012684F44|nr:MULTISPECIES: hypothetical protein [unclassified Prochlorococcus]